MASLHTEIIFNFLNMKPDHLGGEIQVTKRNPKPQKKELKTAWGTSSN